MKSIYLYACMFAIRAVAVFIIINFFFFFSAGYVTIRQHYSVTNVAHDTKPVIETARQMGGVSILDTLECLFL